MRAPEAMEHEELAQRLFRATNRIFKTKLWDVYADFVKTKGLYGNQFCDPEGLLISPSLRLHPHDMLAAAEYAEALVSPLVIEVFEALGVEV